MLWAALLPSPPEAVGGPAPATAPGPAGAGAGAGVGAIASAVREAAGAGADPRHGIATWALQFGPRVALLDEAVLLEAQSSLRLFGGRAALFARVAAGAGELGVSHLAWAPSGLGALALARAGAEASPDGFDTLDGLPLQVLSAARPHQATLARLGCRRLGELRRLPRDGLARRFGPELLEALDRAWGQAPEAYAWFALPETFERRLELPARVESAPALLFAARRLLLQLAGWLVARRSGVLTLTLGWDGGELVLRSAAPSDDAEHLARLLGERLGRLHLGVPAETLWLRADEVVAWQAPNASLLPDPGQQQRALQQALERVAARLGASRVLRPQPVDDHRPERAQRWCPGVPAAQAKAGTPGAAPPGEALRLPQPTLLLPRPLRLGCSRSGRPLHAGAELSLLLGPQRIEAGWWDGAGVARDYWVAAAGDGGLLWLFQTRGADPAWYLHGVFA